MNEFIYEDYLKLFEDYENKTLSEDAKKLSFLFDIFQKESSLKLSKIILSKVINEKGIQVRNLIDLEKRIFMFNPSTLINYNDNTIQYNGIKLK